MSDKVKRARATAHALCLMERDRVCEQTCEMPDGPATYACDRQHAAIDSLILAVAEEVRERAAEAADSFEPVAGFDVPTSVGAAIRSISLDGLVKP